VVKNTPQTENTQNAYLYTLAREQPKASAAAYGDTGRNGLNLSIFP